MPNISSRTDKFILVNDSANADYLLVVTKYIYSEDANTDTYTVDGRTYTIPTTDYHFEIRGDITKLATDQTLTVSGSASPSSHAGKTILGVWTEVGEEYVSGVCGTGIHRFVGRIIKKIRG